MGIALSGKHFFGFNDLHIKGELTHKSIRKEIVFPLDGVGRGATAATLTRLGNTMGWAFSIGDDGYMHFEVPTDWDGISAIGIHLHTYVDDAYVVTSNEDEVQWKIMWSACPEDGTEAVDSATHTGTLDSGDIDIPTVTKALQEIDVGSIPAASLEQHDTISLLLSRIALDDGTNPANEPVVIRAELSYWSNNRGESA